MNRCRICSRPVSGRTSKTCSPACSVWLRSMASIEAHRRRREEAEDSPEMPGYPMYDSQTRPVR